jgi:hypothetical protein
VPFRKTSWQIKNCFERVFRKMAPKQKWAKAERVRQKSGRFPPREFTPRVGVNSNAPLSLIKERGVAAIV